MKKFSFFLALAVFLSPGSMRAQNVNVRVDVVTHVNSARQLMQEADTLFAATGGGLLIHSRSSGTEQLLTTSDGLFDHQLTAVARGVNNRLILGAKSGLLAFVNRSKQTVTNDDNLAGEEVVELLAIEDTLWVLSRNFVSVYLFDRTRDRYQFRESYQDFNVQLERFYGMAYADSRIWLASSNGLISAPANFLKFNLYAVTNWRVQGTGDGLPGNTIYDVAVAGDNSAIFLATSGGVAKYDFTSFTRTPSLNSVRFLDVVGGALFAADFQRVFRISESQSETLYQIAFGQITGLSVDAAGDPWVSIEKRGIRNLKSGERILLDGPLDNHIGEVHVDAAGRLWCTAGTLGETRDQGIFLRTETGWQNYRFFGGSNGRLSGLNSSNPIFEDAEGHIWIGSWGGGIVVFDPELNIHPINPQVDPGAVWISSLTRDDTLTVQTDPAARNVLFPVINADGFLTVVTDIFFNEPRQSVWILDYVASNNQPLVEIGTTAFNLNAFAAGNIKYFPGPFNQNQVHKITQDFVGDLWIAHSGGVVQMRLTGDQVATETYNENNNLKSNQVNAIVADQDGYVWVGTRAGLSAILNQQVFDFRGEFQPIGLKINDIYLDSRNNKWFATDKGLSILKAEGSPFEPASWIDVIPRNSSIDPEQLAFRANVIPADLPSENINSVFLNESTGDVFLGTTAGLAMIRNNPFASTFTDFSQLKVGPNPLVLREGEGATLRFLQLVPGSQVKILTANGQLVRQLSRGILDEVQWDGRNQEGKLVATGVYVYLITSGEGQEAAGKVLVVNE